METDVQVIKATSGLLDSKIKLVNKLKGRYYYFFRHFFDVVQTEPFQYNFHIEYICDELEKVMRRVMREYSTDNDGNVIITKEREEKEYDLIINIPIASTKSMMVSQLLNAWV